MQTLNSGPLALLLMAGVVEACTLVSSGDLSPLDYDLYMNGTDVKET